MAEGPKYPVDRWGIPERGTFKFPKHFKPYYGQAIGIIMACITDKVPSYPVLRIPGNVGNASTFKFPVQFKIIDADYSEILAKTPSKETERKVVEAAKELEQEGVRAIGCMCGYMVYFQEAMANAVNIPVFSSSLLQVPMVSRLIGKKQKIGIITFNSDDMTREHLRRAGIDDEVYKRIAIIGLQEVPQEKYGYTTIKEFEPEARLAEEEKRIVYVAKQLIARHPDIGAIVLECTYLPPAAAAVQQATGLPVFDVTTLLNYAYNAIVRERFTGFV